MKLENIDVGFVQSRYTALEQLWASWATRADDYEKIYLGDIWSGAPDPGERRISAPIAFEQVESNRALLLTKPPVISVPASEFKKVAVDRAEKIEKYLYGTWAQGAVLDVLNNAEWFASCLGAGVIRCLYDEAATEDDFSLLIQSLDPRNVFTNPTGRPGQDSEVIHAYDRTRREIESEWGISLGGAKEGAGHEDWLDEEVEFIDYWRADIEEVKEDEEKVEPQKPTGILSGLFDVAKAALKAGAPEVEGEEEKKTRKVRRRVVINCVVADGQMVKEPVKMPGYIRLPFIRYAGISTPLKGENSELSVLFPITGGTRGEGVVGLASAFNELLVMKQQIIEYYANAAIITDDDKLDIDFSPGAVNSIAKGSTWKFLSPPGPHPSIDNQMRIINESIEDSTINVARRGSEALSGLALSVLNNPALMKIAHRQQTRERAYQELNKLILALTEEYAPIEGWNVWGDTDGEEFDTTLRPDEIGGYYRNVVKLAASLPRDEPGEIMSMSTLVDKGLLSRESFLDFLQQTKALPNQSPKDEQDKILRDKLLFSGPVTEELSKLIIQEYSPELAAELGIGVEPEAPQGPPPGMPPAMPPVMPQGPPSGPPMLQGPPGMPQGPMQGIPPSVVAPTPDMLGATSGPEALINRLEQRKVFPR